MRQTVFIGLSGGVDSAVSAALLKRRGYRCVGIFLESWSTAFGPSQCHQASDRRDAARVAAHLGIPFLVLPCADRYRERVLQYFLEEIQQGRTPNPDARCNAEIKFRVFLDASLAAGADRIATGHYARLIDRALGPSLHRAVDSEKDQSYFLARVKPNRFRHVLFPIGHLHKTEVRKLARDFHLPNATKKDSQGLCFVGKIALPEFLQHFFTAPPGPVLDRAGRILGRHTGLSNYTLGQRHGFHAAVGRPQYVVGKNRRTNTLVVADSPADGATAIVPCAGWIAQGRAVGQTALTAKLRYRQPDQPLVRFTLQAERATLVFSQPQPAVTPGQIAVIYQGGTVIGSATIV